MPYITCLPVVCSNSFPITPLQVSTALFFKPFLPQGLCICWSPDWNASPPNIHIDFSLAFFQSLLNITSSVRTLFFITLLKTLDLFALFLSITFLTLYYTLYCTFVYCLSSTIRISSIRTGIFVYFVLCCIILELGAVPGT